MTKKSTIALVVAGVVSLVVIILLIVIKNSVKRNLEKRRRLERSIRRRDNWKTAQAIMGSEGIVVEPLPEHPLPPVESRPLPPVLQEDKGVESKGSPAQKTRPPPKPTRQFRPSIEDRVPVMTPSSSSINGVPVSQAIGLETTLQHPASESMTLEAAIEKAVGSIACPASHSYEALATSTGPIVLEMGGPLGSQPSHMHLLMESLRMAEMLAFAIHELGESPFEPIDETDSCDDDNMDDSDSDRVSPVVEEVLDEEDDPRISFKESNTVEDPEEQARTTVKHGDCLVTMTTCDEAAQNIITLEENKEDRSF